MKVNLLLIISLIVYIIPSVKSECQFIEMYITDPYIIRIKTPTQFCIHIDITSMKTETEGEITFIFPQELLLHNQIKQFNVKSVLLPKEASLSEKDFPSKKEPGSVYFPIETAFENKYDNSLNTMKHIYFIRESTNDDENIKVYLVMYLDINIYNLDLFSYYEISILSPILSNEISSLDLSGENLSQSEEINISLSPKIPKYLHVYYSDNVIRNNYLLFSNGKPITYTCGSFLLKRKDTYIINPNRHYGYFIDFNSLNSNSRVCLSLIIKFVTSDPAERELQIKVEYLSMPFKGLPMFDMYQTTYSVNVEINDIENQYNLLGRFPNEIVVDKKFYVYVNYFFGFGDIYYKSSKNIQDINEHSLSSSSEYIHYSNSSFLLKLANKDNDLNIFHVKCETSCLIHFELFEIYNEDIEDINNDFNILNVEYPGVYFMSISSGLNYFVYFSNALIFNYELENLNGEEIKGSIELDKFDLSMENRIQKGSFDYSGEYGELLIEMHIKSTKNNALLKLKVSFLDDIEEIKINTHDTHNIGNYTYSQKTFLFKFPIDDIIYDSYQIQILSQDDTNPEIKRPISLYSYFDLGNENIFVLPSAYNAHIDYLAEPTYKFKAEISNPYDRPYSIIPKSNNKMFYYYAVRFQNFEKDSKVFIAFTGAEKPKYLYLTQNTMFSIDLEAGINNNYLLQKGGIYRDSSLIVNFYKCNNNVDTSFQITQLNNKTITSDNIFENRLRSISKDIGIDYIINFNTNAKSKMIMTYTYESNANLLPLNEYQNNTVYYKISTVKRVNNVLVKFKPYFINGKQISYSIYLIPFDKTNTYDECSFFTHSSIISLIHDDTNGSDVETTLHNVSPGSYWLQIVAQESQNYHSFKLYDKVLINVHMYLHSKLMIMKFMIIMLSIISIMMVLFILKTNGKIFTTKRTHYQKKFSNKYNENSMQLEEK